MIIFLEFIVVDTIAIRDGHAVASVLGVKLVDVIIVGKMVPVAGLNVSIITIIITVVIYAVLSTGDGICLGVFRTGEGQGRGADGVEQDLEGEEERAGVLAFVAENGDHVLHAEVDQGRGDIRGVWVRTEEISDAGERLGEVGGGHTVH